MSEATLSVVAVADPSASRTGIGRASAFRLAKRGYHIVVADLQVDLGTQVALEITQASPSIKAVFTRLVRCRVVATTAWASLTAASRMFRPRPAGKKPLLSQLLHLEE